ncbi:MAG: hypothetical protein N4A54_06520 [Peptostreptococcaceae bacterium]|jgi:hypothetical protein|nr:hypothetical protein [Peptostreptococcaceae bacterium]
MLDKIQKRISEMDNLRDRATLKELLNDILIPLYEHDNFMFETLNKRIFDEIEYEDNDFSIYTTVVSKIDYDPLNYFLHPIINNKTKEDLNTNIKESLNKDKIKLDEVFLKLDYLKLNELLRKDISFSGKLITDKNSYDAKFRLEKNKSFKEKIENLYKVFIKNNIRWKTFNTTYLKKILDIYLIDFDIKQINYDEKIIDYQIDFLQYKEFIKVDIVPLWNIENKKLSTTGFPMPCEDKINYEHKIEIIDEDDKESYLLNSIENNIKNIRQTKNGLIIIVEEDQPKEWEVLRLINKKESKLDRYEYEIISNKKDNSFINRLNNYNNSNIKTKAELKRLLNSFELSKNMEFIGLNIANEYDKEIQTYNMNDFIEDEIRECESNRLMILKLKINEENKNLEFLKRDKLSFLISEIQMYFPEYKCVGELI